MAGLHTYQQLLELSKQRQLAPPKDMLMTQESDIERAKSRWDPVDLHEKMLNHSIKLPNLNQMLPKKLRAKKLMDQKATSVADAAFALELMNRPKRGEIMPGNLQERLDNIEVKRLARHKDMSQRAKHRLKLVREQEENKAQQLQHREALVQRMDNNQGQLMLNYHAARRISIEYDGTVLRSGQVQELEEIKAAHEAKDEISKLNTRIYQAESELTQIKRDARRAAKKTEREKWVEEHKGQDLIPELSEDELHRRVQAQVDTAKQAKEDELSSLREERAQLATKEPVKVLWADLRDWTYAAEWPANVEHGELARQAVSKANTLKTFQHRAIDEDENWIEAQRQSKKVNASSTVHVIGGESQPKASEETEEAKQARRAAREIEAKRTMDHLAMQKMAQLRSSTQKAVSNGIANLEDGNMVDALQEQVRLLDESLKEPHPVEEKEKRRAVIKERELLKRRITAAQDMAQLSRLELQHPAVVEESKRYVWWQERRAERDGLARRVGKLQRRVHHMKDMSPELRKAHLKGRKSPRKLLQEAQSQLDTLDREHPQFADLDNQLSQIKQAVGDREQEMKKLQAQSTEWMVMTGGENIDELERKEINVKRQEAEDQMEQLKQLQEEDQRALQTLVRDAERDYRKAEKPVPSEIKFEDRTTSRRGRAQSDADIQALRDAGIEVDAPRKGIWARVKGLLGR